MFVSEIQLSPTNMALGKRIWIFSAIAKSEVDNWPSNQIWLFAELKAKLKAVSSGEPQNRVSQWCNAFTDMSHSELQRCWKKQTYQGAQLPMLRSAVVSKWGPTQQAPHYTVPGTTPAPTTSANKREQEIMEKQRRGESDEAHGCEREYEERKQPWCCPHHWGSLLLTEKHHSDRVIWVTTRPFMAFLLQEVHLYVAKCIGHWTHCMRTSRKNAK